MSYVLYYSNTTTKGCMTSPKTPSSAAYVCSIISTMTEPSENTSAAPKRDKFASMKVAQQQQPQTTPKRDKFASMAAAAQQSQTAAAAIPKRNKFASMVAAVAGESLTATPSEKDTETIVKEKMKQRDKVLKDLEQAEGWTWQLLTLASQTAKSLSDLTADTTDISETSAKYRETLQKIHSILTPHAHLVVSYQNHQVDKKEEATHDAEGEERINMYAARVEMRLAQERRNVLRELLRLEKESEDSLSAPPEAVAGDKRKREDELD